MTTLDALLDRLIPPVGDLPAAGAMGIGADMAVGAADYPPYAAARNRCLAALPAGFATLGADAQDAAIRTVEAALPADFDALLKAAYIAYYARAEVNKRIGWRTGPLQPAGFDLPPFEESVLETVRQRDPFWRQAPE